MKFRLLSRALLLVPAALLIATPALAGPDKPDSIGTIGASTTMMTPPPSDPNAISGGFSLFKAYGGTYVGGYGTFARRITNDTDHPVAVVGQVAIRHSSYYEETQMSFLGGAEVTAFRNESMCVSARVMAGLSHWVDESNDLNFQATAVLEYHLKSMHGASIEVEAGILCNHEDEFTGHGLVLNIGFNKTWGGK